MFLCYTQSIKQSNFLRRKNTMKNTINANTMNMSTANKIANMMADFGYYLCSSSGRRPINWGPGYRIMPTTPIKHRHSMDIDGVVYPTSFSANIECTDFTGTVKYRRVIFSWETKACKDEIWHEPNHTFESVIFTDSNGNELTYKRQLIDGVVRYESLH